MPVSLYIASTGPASGKSLVTFGMMDFLVRRTPSVGYFQPIMSRGKAFQDELDAICAHCRLQDTGRVVVGFSNEEAAAIMAARGQQALHKAILDKYKELEARCEFVLCVGTDFAGSSTAFEFEFNMDVARNLGAPLLPVIDGSGLSQQALVERVSVIRRAIRDHKSPVLSMVVSRVDPAEVEAMRQRVGAAFAGEDDVFVINEEPALTRPTVQDVVNTLGARVIQGTPVSLKREIRDVKVGAMGLSHFLDYIIEGGLVAVPGDRADILAGCVLADRSQQYPSLACLVLSGETEPDERVYRLLIGEEGSQLPILALTGDTLSVARQVDSVRGWLSSDNDKKVALALDTFYQAMDMERIADHFQNSEVTGMTPLMFEHMLMSRARADRRRIVLPEGEDARILEAAAALADRGVAEITLLGNVEAVCSKAAELGLDPARLHIVDPLSSEWHAEFAAEYLRLREHKGVNLEMAEDRMADPTYFGTMMVHLGRADGMVSGAVNTTAHTLRPSFEFVKTRPGVALVSSVFFMCLEDRVLVYGDCAVNPKPDSGQLADIAASAAATAAMFGVEPRVAMLSYSSGDSGTGDEVERVRTATALLKERHPELAIEGPIQYDAATDMAVAASKLPGSPVAGRATVFIFPDLNAGNNAYKAVQRTADAVAVGPVLQGLNKPINDLSRGCTVADIINTVAITAIQAQQGA